MQAEKYMEEKNDINDLQINKIHNLFHQNAITIFFSGWSCNLFSSIKELHGHMRAN